MTLIAKNKLAQQKMEIEKKQLNRDVSCHQQEVAEYERKIEELEDEFGLDYAPDELNSSKLGFDDDYTKQNMLKEKTKLMEEEGMEFGDDEDFEDESEESGSESSDGDRK